MAGHRVALRFCFACGREFRLYVPWRGGGPRPQVVDAFPCPHCGLWEAEEVVDPDRHAPVLIEPCQRTAIEWWQRRATRSLRQAWLTARARLASARIAASRLRTRWQDPTGR